MYTTILQASMCGGDLVEEESARTESEQSSGRDDRDDSELLFLIA
jgi:hypothetical protein